MFSPKAKLLTILGLQPTGDLGPLTGYTSKRGKPVWFLKAPPTKPPTGWQVHQRNKFRLAAVQWAMLLEQERQAWLDAARLAHLTITGYNLFVYYHCTHDRATIATIEHQSGVQLLPQP